MGVIYKITSPNNKIYIGKAIDLKKRFNCHRHVCNKDGSTIILYNSIKKYGWDAHVIEIVETVDNSILNEREVFWIKELKSYVYENSNGMNMTVGGDGNKGSWMNRLDLREQASKRFSGKGNPFYGKTHSEEIKRELSKISKERNLRTGHTIPEWGAEKGREVVRRAIICYGNDGNFIGEYSSLTETEKKLNLTPHTVASSLERNSWYKGKYYFKYKVGNDPVKIKVGDIKLRNEKRIVLYLNGTKVKEYPCALEASIALGIPKTTINRAAMYNKLKPIRTGHIFIYKDLYEAKKVS